MIVVDTNVLAYLLIEGDRTAACREVLEKDAEWCAPFLWRSEFRNVLTTHMRHAGMSTAGALERMGLAEGLFAGREYSVGSDTVLAFTASHEVSAYDAEFLCLAIKLDLRLLTTDKRLLTKRPEIASSPEAFQMKANGHDRETIRRTRERLKISERGLSLIDSIRSAFSGVPLGSGRGPDESRGMDNHEDDASLARRCEGDEAHPWERVPVFRTQSQPWWAFLFRC